MFIHVPADAQLPIRHILAADILRHFSTGVLLGEQFRRRLVQALSTLAAGDNRGLVMAAAQELL